MLWLFRVALLWPWDRLGPVNDPPAASTSASVRMLAVVRGMFLSAEKEEEGRKERKERKEDVVELVVQQARLVRLASNRSCLYICNRR